jgi:hypothetical protein
MGIRRIERKQAATASTRHDKPIFSRRPQAVPETIFNNTAINAGAT